jgi:hypothetical protein
MSFQEKNKEESEINHGVYTIFLLAPILSLASPSLPSRPSLSSDVPGKIQYYGHGVVKESAAAQVTA